jgi:hypothetical protein
VNTDTDRVNCGGCEDGSGDYTCAAGEICSGGGCVTSCPAPQTACSGACVYTQTDDLNCGACGNVCGEGQACSGGTCDLGDWVITGAQSINETAAGGVTGTLGATRLAVSSTAGFAAGQLVLIHQTLAADLADAGYYELVEVLAVEDATLTIADPLVRSYTSGGDDLAQVVVVPRFANVTVEAGAVLTAPAWNGTTGGILALDVVGQLVVNGTVDMVGRGSRAASHVQCPYACQAGTAGESPTGPGVQGNARNGTGGGGGTQAQDCAAGGGGGHVSAGGAGANGSGAGGCGNPGLQPGGAGGDAVGTYDLTERLLFGGAGGEGGSDEDGAYPGSGGNGGGIILLRAAAVSAAGPIRADGLDGTDGVTSYQGCGGGCGMGGGGGGAGGAILVDAGSSAILTASVTGGSGGQCTCGGYPAGQGSVGALLVSAPICPVGQEYCNGACVDTRFDPEHCGGCDQACTSPDDSAYCLDGACGYVGCDANLADCDGDAGNVCETNLFSSDHCGACGASCSDGSTATEDVCAAPFTCENRTWVTLCDQGMTSATCGVPGNSTPHFFDFDTPAKVPALTDPRADLSKGHVDCCNWNVWNGAQQVDTGVPISEFATVVCSPTDGRTYGATSIPYFQPATTVICLRTALGRYVKYTGRADCCADITLDWAPTWP